MYTENLTWHSLLPYVYTAKLKHTGIVFHAAI